MTRCLRSGAGTRLPRRRARGAALIGLLACTPLAAQQPKDPAEAVRAVAAAVGPYGGTFEPPTFMQAPGFEWDHEIRVVLPPSYASSPDREYPVLWVMDGAFHLGMAADMARQYAMAGLIPELIVVGVGHRPAETLAEFVRRRTVDLFFDDLEMTEGAAAAAYLERTMGADIEELVRPGARGAEFLRFLVDDVRPALAARYRMADDHALFGHSAGGAFASRALFERPGAFDRFIIGSGTDQRAIGLASEYAAAHADLEASVFIGAGDLEAMEPMWAAQRIVSAPLRLAEDLRLLQLPSLRLELRLYRDRDHTTVVPLTLGDGLAFVYGDPEREAERP